jgi:hypothetical protein
VNRNRNYWFLLFGLIALLLGSIVGCGQPGFTTYVNEQMGYTINYPLNWKVEVSEDGTTCLISSPTRVASLMIYVTDYIPVQTAAQYWLMSLGTHWSVITQIENKPTEGFWGWYVSYQYEAETGTFRGEAYFKSTPEHLYRLDTAANAAEYNNYPFSAMISSFKLK